MTVSVFQLFLLCAAVFLQAVAAGDQEHVKSDDAASLLWHMSLTASHNVLTLWQEHSQPGDCRLCYTAADLIQDAVL